MGLFSKDSLSTEKIPDKGEQVRNMAGYPDLATASGVAPASTQRPVSTDETSSKSKRATKTQQQAAAPGPSAEQIAKERLRLEAMKTIGENLMREVAALPYDVWSFMASDPSLKLEPEEQKKLAEAYYLLAQAVNPDFSSPWMIGFSLLLQNAALVGKRMKMLADKQRRLDDGGGDEMPAVMKKAAGVN